MKILATLLLIVLPTVGQPSLAQDKTALARRFIASMKKNEPQWKVDESETLGGEGLPVAVYLTWRADKKALRVLVYVLDSIEDAKKSYPTAFNNCVDCWIVKKHLNEKIQNLGDENRSWEDEYSPLVGIVFRKGKTVVGVEAPSKELARRLAFYLVNQIDE